MQSAVGILMVERKRENGCDVVERESATHH
jgi:hypothetical protein